MEHMRPDQMAKLIRVSKRTVYRMLQEGVLDEGLLRGRMVVKVPLELQKLIQVNDRLLRPAEVAAIMQASRSSVYRWFHEDEIDGIMIGETLRLFESAVADFVKRRTNVQE